MTVMQMTGIIVIKSLWWIIPVISGITLSAIIEWREDHR